MAILILSIIIISLTLYFLLTSLKEIYRIPKIIEHLEKYAELLTEHIKKEDEILYPWMDRNLSISQIGELFSRFDEAEKKLKGYQEKYEKIIQKLSEKI